ncbi:Gfo/Idh/MocA family protein [Fimbriimonas ginsengisoli]|uniref:Oxidoreductase domain protein n=1 Tax=Fimbriimonas ginsengisoli Gsoil 348 TaxID=661478 RepID=A0A068NM57_FIMGI|nr:Gfo/Idh/MocA family oxidoreductase [Fimbriimonas ginsengisoli]AIE84643.1 oxidoreductase domain protein [Fimbriimonas ginsengisoli Gsoil 348]
MSRRDRTLRVAVAGVGGFAGQHHLSLAELESEGECRVVATCDPSAARLGQAGEQYRFEQRGVSTYPNLGSLLQATAGEIDVVTLPTPIPLHAAQHEAVVEAGAACYLEKPPSLWWPEYLEMLERDGRASRQTQVGFNFTGDPMRQELKSRILSGEFGVLRGVSLLAEWPRDREYYTRNDWAGRLRVGDRWVLDSCIGNALAHYVQNLLFWCGKEGAVGEVEEVWARLFRAHPIESYDTAFVSARTDGGAWLRIGATHTGKDRYFERETLVLDQATIRFDTWRSGEIEHRNGTRERFESSRGDHAEMLRENLREYFAYVRGDRPRPTTRLEDCRGFVSLCDLALVSCGGIEEIARERIETDDLGRVQVEGLERELTAFVEHETWPTGELPLESARMDDLDCFEATMSQRLGL